MAAVLLGSVAYAQNVSIGVLGLFHPRELTLSATGESALIVHTRDQAFILENSSGITLAHFRCSGDATVVEVGSRVIDTTDVWISGREGSRAIFVLAIPGKISRRYFGTLQVKAISGTLVPVLSMDIETAVASVLAAETTGDTPLEALKAQAVATRSYFAAGAGRHRDFAFCDTTHCQFLREPPAPGLPPAKATSDTRGLVIAYDSRPFPAMYTRSCHGQTRTPAEVGLPVASYPYYSVECEFCRKHPSHWQSRISAENAPALQRSNENARLEIDRRLGWNAIQSNDFNVKQEGDHLTLAGTGQGHGIGLCQSGAKAMAHEGASFRQILSHYYPNTTIVSLPPNVAAVR
jgi:stage II sporulation protein D